MSDGVDLRGLEAGDVADLGSGHLLRFAHAYSRSSDHSPVVRGALVSFQCWHDCPGQPPGESGWIEAREGERIVGLEPLHVEPPLVCPFAGCGDHGHIIGGVWVTLGKVGG